MPPKSKNAASGQQNKITSFFTAKTPTENIQTESTSIEPTESVENVVAEQTTPKKRGRPRKTDNPPTNDASTITESSPAKKRGRPKKKAEDEPQEAEETSTTPKKRGRPRKNPLPESVVENGAAEDDTTENETPKPTLAKRGRPKKNATPSSSEQNGIQSENGEEKPKKPRGAKRKAPSAADDEPKKKKRKTEDDDDFVPLDSDDDVEIVDDGPEEVEEEPLPEPIDIPSEEEILSEESEEEKPKRGKKKTPSKSRKTSTPAAKRTKRTVGNDKLLIDYDEQEIKRKKLSDFGPSVQSTVTSVTSTQFAEISEKVHIGIEMNPKRNTDMSVSTKNSGKMKAQIDNTKFKIIPKALQLHNPYVINDSVCMINAGGPIWSLDWCTSCEDKGAQYAVVCVHPKTPVYVGRTYPGTTQNPPPLHQLIQLWEFDMKNLTENPPKVRYYVEHNHGFVWDIRWMPCTLDDNDDRLGIVAVAFSDNSLVLYSLPKPETINFEGEGVPTIRLTEQVYTIKNTIPVFLKVKDADEETEAEATPKKKKPSKKGKKKEDESIEEEELEEEEEELPAPDEYTKVMRSVAWSPSLEYLAVGSISGSVLLYKVNHNKQDCVLKLLMDNIGHYQQKQFSPVNNVTWSSLDSNIFATVGNSGDVCVWDVRDMMQPIYSQTMTRQISNQVVFPKGINAFIVAAETLVKQYDAIDGVSIFLSKQDSATWGMSVTSTRSGFMTTNASGAAYLYSLEEDGIGKKKKGVAGRIDERIIKVRNVHNQLCIGLPHHNIKPLEHMLDVEDAQTKRKDVDLKAYDPKVALSCIQFHPSQEYNYWTLVGGVSGVLMLLKIPTKYSIKAKK